MSSSLSDVPLERRRRLAGTLGLFAVLFVAIGAVSATGANDGLLKAVVVVAFVVAVLLALMAWGVAVSVQNERADRRHETALDTAVAEALAAGGHLGTHTYGCGHEHDPDELHITDACAHDGGGADCAHTCDTCVLSALRPAATTGAAAGSRRPQPHAGRPRPTPSGR